MMNYYAQTMPGVEEIAWLEIKARLPGARFGAYHFARDQFGLVLFEYAGPPGDLLQLRTVDDVFLQALILPKLSRGYGDLALIRETIQKSEPVGFAINSLMRWRKFNQAPTYCVVSHQFGRHEYRHKDLRRAIADGLARRYRHWQPVTENGQVEVWASLLGSTLLCGLRLSDQTMAHRFQKAMPLPPAIRPSVAAAMIWLTEPQADDCFLDPFCGSGILLMERHYAGPYGQIIGFDTEGRHVEAAQRNLARELGKAGQSRQIRIRRWDFQKLSLASGSVDRVAANLPTESPGALQTLYSNVLTELARVVRPDGRLVLRSRAFEQLRNATRSQPSLLIRRGYSIAVRGEWSRIYILERQP